MGLVLATWVGPGGYQLADGTQLVYGETVCSIPQGEALMSDHWHYEAPKSPKGSDKSGSKE